MTPAPGDQTALHLDFAWSRESHQGPWISEADAGFSFVDCHVNVIAPNFNGMDGDWFNGRHAQRTPGLEIEASSMARTLNLAIDQLAFGKRTAIVGTHIVNRVVCARDME
jgi:hypothetical protein